VEERLLLDRIALHASHVTPGNIQNSALVVTDLANSGLTFRNGTTMAAGMAAHTVALELFVQVSLTNVVIENFAKCSHCTTSTHDFIWKCNRETRLMGLGDLMILEPLIGLFLHSDKLRMAHS
jgi:hypothetical protein